MHGERVDAVRTEAVHVEEIGAELPTSGDPASPGAGERREEATDAARRTRWKRCRQVPHRDPVDLADHRAGSAVHGPDLDDGTRLVQLTRDLAHVLLDAAEVWSVRRAHERDASPMDVRRAGGPAPFIVSRTRQPRRPPRGLDVGSRYERLVWGLDHVSTRSIR